MSRVIVRIPTPLRPYTGGADEVEVVAITVGEALAALGRRHEGLLARICAPDGSLRPFVNVYLGADNVRGLDGLATPLPGDGAVLAIVPAVAGGAGGARERRLAELKASVPEIGPREAFARQTDGAALIDVREADEIAQGSPHGAFRLGRGFLELRIEETIPDPDRLVLVMCAGGTRSLFAAEGLQRLGYRNVASVAGGFSRWKAEGLPFETPHGLDPHAHERYARHLTMPEIGEAGQQRLLESRVLMIGAGGLGCPAALYLAAAGVGTLGIVDHDVVDRSNLQRQVLHNDERIGQAKVDSARRTLQTLNPTVNIATYRERLTSANVERILSGYDVVVDGSDNFPTRYLVNDACVHLRIPCVHGSVYRFEGQVTVFWPHCPAHRGPCYRCLYPEPPPAEFAPSCADAGVLGVLPGVVGLLEAVETIKLLLGLGDPLIGRLLHYDALRARFDEYRLAANPDCALCADGRPFPGYVDYEAFCATAA
ncbi:molybdopterin-synthase adenylyltransferase MoeB [Aromatoleum diolicum]|uniref:Molybdopterin-synthase adenylyltransferase MoeB n=1 Tax=Aromatoleum diolicum TaxID=75796 RepID=A0ABX1QA23_9RHOO|nr:molybdopterin-synthase adenylyltransferase MoeB [Aromatoleum diolicum]NMG75168.1 molybdopterin-synthase adenylyltransferase MoeB [Aromatoleum diolicum]